MKQLRTQRVYLRDNDIFIPNADIPHEEIDRDFGEPTLKREVYCFTLIGQHDYLDEHDNPALMDTEKEEAEDRDLAFAKKVITKNRSRHFIKQGPDGRLFNPLGIDEWTHNKTKHKTGEKVWHYTEVSPEAFDLYMKFLRTKNVAYHKNAERETF